MLYRKVPKNGDELSILGFGAMRLPVRMQSINEPLAEKQILSCIDQGVNYIDTAVTYHGGKSESFLGKILSKDGYREKVKIATKLPHWMTSSRKDMDEILDKQLEKLQTDRIDYYLIHGLTGGIWEKSKQKGAVEFLDDALKNGKILNAGFSFHGLADEFKVIIDDYDWTFCLIQYNILDTKNQAGTPGLKYAASKDMAVMVMEPLRGGNLAKTPPQDVQNIWDKAETKRTPVEWSLRWIWDHPEVTVVLSGMNEFDQINENIAIAEEALPNSLTENELALVDEAADAFRNVMKVGCTGCQYCMPCPAGVNIPNCFEHYNNRHVFKAKMIKMIYLAYNGGVLMDDVTLASQCVKCGECLDKCPQSLPIQDLLEEVANDMEGIMTKPMIWLAKRMAKTRKNKDAA